MDNIVWINVSKLKRNFVCGVWARLSGERDRQTDRQTERRSSISVLKTPSPTSAEAWSDNITANRWGGSSNSSNTTLYRHGEIIEAGQHGAVWLLWRKWDHASLIAGPQCLDCWVSLDTAQCVGVVFLLAMALHVTLLLTLRASLSGTFLETLPDLVTPLKGHSLSPRSCPLTLPSAPSESFGY